MTSDHIPMFGTYCRLGVHACATAMDVLRAARRKIAKEHRTGRARRTERHNFYRVMISHHRRAKQIYFEAIALRNERSARGWEA